MNLLLTSDSYKHSFHKFYQRQFTGAFAYIMPRVKDELIVPFGLSMAIMKYLSKPITNNDVNEAEDIIKQHGLPFNKALWSNVLYKHKGFLPLRIRGVPEGSVVPSRTPIVTIESTCKERDMFTLVTFIETVLQRAVYYPTTIASLGYKTKQRLKELYELSSDKPELVDFALHDFGARGVSSEESAEIGGLAHLVNFRGTDNLSAIVAGRKYYNNTMAGTSIAATEHSVQCSYGEKGQYDYIAKAVLNSWLPAVSIVLDGYDIYREVRLFCEIYNDKNVNNNQMIVLRLDSGDPSVVIKNVLIIMSQKLQWTFNTKGYKVFKDNIKIMQGDGIDYETVVGYLKLVTDLGWAAETIVFGSGGGLLQRVDRDIYGFAQKTSAIEINNEWIDVVKNPVGDVTKASIGGRISTDDMILFYENGTTYNYGNLDDVRFRLAHC